MNKEIELKQITHLTNDEYTFLINYITEKENKARQEVLKEVEKKLFPTLNNKYYGIKLSYDIFNKIKLKSLGEKE